MGDEWYEPCYTVPIAYNWNKKNTRDSRHLLDARALLAIPLLLLALSVCVCVCFFTFLFGVSIVSECDYSIRNIKSLLINVINNAIGIANIETQRNAVTFCRQHIILNFWNLQYM